jgi:hypothetical protein
MRGLISRVVLWARKHPTVVGALAAGGLALVLYARTINFGFFGDDPSGHFRWIEEVPWTDWFIRSPGNFVRPLQFIVYKLLWLIQGGYGAPGYHLLLLILHVANTLLVGVLASSLSRRHSYGWLAAILFTTFPLSHEVVSEVDALCHPLVTLWALLAIILFERGRRTGNRRCLWAVHPVLLLALLTHENGLVIPFVILFLELIYYPPRSARALLRGPALQYFVLPLLFLLWWTQIPKDTIAAPHTLGALLRNTLPFLQAAAYPWLPIARLDVNQWMGLLALVGATLILTYVAARALGLIRIWLFAMAWVALAAAPAVLFLEWDYLFGGPRLYYLASVGAALLWALPPIAIIALAKGSVARRGIFIGAGVLLALAIMLPPIPFIRCQLDLFDQATALVRLVSAQASTAPSDRDLVYVNLPTFFISSAKHPLGCPSTYPFVSTGVGVFPPYADLRDFVRVNGGPDRPARGVTVADYDPNWPPRYGDALAVSALRDILKRDHVYVFEIGSWSLRDLSAAWQPNAEPSPTSLATFADALVLEDAAVQQRGNDLVVTLQWRVRQVPPQLPTAFAHVYDEAGNLLAQHDGPLGRNDAPADYVPISLWQAGDKIRDVHAIPLQSSPLPNSYTVAVGLYDPATMKRVHARSDEDAALPDDLYRLRQ